jgi:peptidoglycan hydrolase CwlO-like protein
MFGFWNRQGTTSTEAAELRAQLASLGKEFRALRDEVHEDMERAFRHRKAAEAAQRRDAKEAAGAPSHSASPGADASALPPSLWGAKRRRLMRALRPSDPAPNGTED